MSTAAPKTLLEVCRATARRAPDGGLTLLVEVSNQSGRAFSRSTLTARLYDASGSPLREVQAPAGAIGPGEQVLAVPVPGISVSRAVALVECHLECVLTTWATTVRHITPHQEAAPPAPPRPPAEARGLLTSGGVEDVPDEDVIVEPPPRREAPWAQAARPPAPEPSAAADARPRPRAEPVQEGETPWQRAARHNAAHTARQAERRARADEIRAEQEAERQARGPDPNDPWEMFDSGDMAAAERLLRSHRLDRAGTARVRALLSSPDAAQVALGCTISRWTRWSAPILLRPLLRHEDPRVREAAVAALGVVSGPSLLNDILPLTTDPDAQVVAAATLAVAQIRGEVPRQ